MKPHINSVGEGNYHLFSTDGKLRHQKLSQVLKVTQQQKLAELDSNPVWQIVFKKLSLP